VEFVEGAIDELGTVRDIMLAILVELNNARKTPSDSPGGSAAANQRDHQAVGQRMELTP